MLPNEPFCQIVELTSCQRLPICLQSNKKKESEHYSILTTLKQMVLLKDLITHFVIRYQCMLVATSKTKPHVYHIYYLVID